MSDEGRFVMNNDSTSVDYFEGQKRLCEEYNVDFKTVEELNSTLASQLDEVVRECAEKILEVSVNVSRNMGYWEEIWKLSASPAVNLTPKQKSLQELFLYLVLSEGIFSEIIQAIAFILMENHHDIYNPERMKFVENYEELDKIPLFVKLQFLKKHEFKFVADAIDKKLRNSIAHLSFIVNDDGSIVDRRTGKITKDLREKTNYLGCVCALTIRAIGGTLQNATSRLGIKTRLKERKP